MARRKSNVLADAELRPTMPEAYPVRRGNIRWVVSLSVDRVPDQSMGPEMTPLIVGRHARECRVFSGTDGRQSQSQAPKQLHCLGALRGEGKGLRAMFMQRTGAAMALAARSTRRELAHLLVPGRR